MASLAGYIPRWFTRPQTVTHPGTNRVRRSATTLIEANALPLSLSQIANRACVPGLSNSVLATCRLAFTHSRLVSVITQGVRNSTRRIAPQAYSVRQRRREKSHYGNARACGSQRRATGVSQTIRTVLFLSASPQLCRQRAGGVAVRCVTSLYGTLT